MRRRTFLRSLIGGGAILLARPLSAWAGSLEDGDAAWAKGDLEAALSAWRAALNAEADATRRVELLLRVASAQRQTGRLAEAGKTLDEAEATGLLPVRVANDRGLLLLAAGDAPAAEAKLKGAFSAAQTMGDPALAATAASNLGLARLALGRPDQAAKAFEVALQLFTTLDDALGRADALTNAGLAGLRAGRLREARASLEEAIRLYVGKREALGQLDATNDLGVVLQALGLDDEAATLYQAALPAAPDPRRRAALTANLATVFHRKGEEARARTLYGEAEAALIAAGQPDEAVAVALQRALLGTPDPAEYRRLYGRAKAPAVRATAALNLAGLIWKDKPDEAVALAKEARDLAPATTGWRADYLEGRVALAAGHKGDALPLLERAVETLDRTRTTLGEDEAQGFSTRHTAVYEALVEARLGMGDTRGVAAAAEALALSDHDGPLVEDDPAAADLRALSDRQRWLEAELADAPAPRRASLVQQRAQVQAEISLTIDKLRASHPNFAELVRTDPEDLEAVRAELPEGVVVVQPVLLPERLVLLIYRRERLVVREVTITAETLSTQVGSVARSLRAADTWDPEWTAQQCDQLGESLLAPIADELATATMVVISATGVFRQLPFSLLRHEGKWLIESAPVAAVTHVGSLRKASGRFKANGGSMLFVGNPDGSLPGAETEVKLLGRRFSGAKVLVGPEGSREQVLEAARGRSLVHLATHGVLDPTVPDRSHIVLTGYPAAEGRLGYREIPGLGPWLEDTRMVVLSACESGLPSAAVSREKPALAINGIAGQFRRAGVETLVASLWKVSDDGTQALMTTFYERLGKGDDIAQSMRAAQLAMLADPQLAHPYYWAPFIIVGDWR